jgi:RHS repeat-associated protein
LYGSSRLGSHTRNVAVAALAAPADTSRYARILGYKQYELKNHLGNVLATITDQKEPVDTDSDDIVDYWLPRVLTVTDYYPFGMQMPGRVQSTGEYRFGFNGMEQDNDVKGQGNSLDFSYRFYDSRIGKFLSIDPIGYNYPYYSPYQFAGNKPIIAIDYIGLHEFIIHYKIGENNEPVITKISVQYTGSNKHTYTISYPIKGSPNLHVDALYVTNEDGNIIDYNPTVGMDGNIKSNPLLNEHARIIYVSYIAYRLNIVDKTGFPKMIKSGIMNSEEIPLPAKYLAQYALTSFPISTIGYNIITDEDILNGGRSRTTEERISKSTWSVIKFIQKGGVGSLKSFVIETAIDETIGNNSDAEYFKEVLNFVNMSTDLTTSTARGGEFQDHPKIYTNAIIRQILKQIEDASQNQTTEN